MLHYLHMCLNSQVYVAVMALSRAGQLLVEHGLAVACLYLKHMQDKMPRYV